MPCSVRDVDEFVSTHYLGKRPGVVVLALMMLQDWFAVGMILYALPPRETAKRYGGVTWEMARLWIGDEIPKNGESWLIAKSVKYIRRERPEVVALVTYADPSVGHSGAVYKAANWVEDGRTDEGRTTPRFDLQDAKTGKRYGRRSHVPEGADVVRVPRVSKSRFIYRLR
ncbi:MAG: hypothetical protein ACKVQA_06885 [Burkholderiales bacterium]